MFTEVSEVERFQNYLFETVIPFLASLGMLSSELSFKAWKMITEEKFGKLMVYNLFMS